ncbi:MAG: hypothetical protein RDV41_10335, partial [Planctomycetota bacterium]|nr:hypothetical protein [Planctomycetota bacterium]
MRRLAHPFATALLIVALGAVVAPRAFPDDPQDVVYMKDGTQRAGIIDEESSTAIRLRVRLGAVWIERSEIARIEKAPTALEQYKKRAAELKPGDAEARFALSNWCRQKGLAQQASELIAKTLEIDPDHAGAHRALGRIKVDGSWVSEEEHMKAQGFVRHGD